jgi:predicted AlkP superfamily phosphohydrolase/phosphomutase
MENGVMPFLDDFTASGVRGELRSTVPALTPPAWTSLMTGRSPGEHGIFDFFRKQSPESPHIRFLTSRDVECETIWSLVSRKGLRATVLNFPLTFPPPPMDGYLMPGGWMPWKQLRLGCHPEGLYDELRELPGFDPRGLAMDASDEEKALEGCEPDEYEAWIDRHIRREQQWVEILSYLMRKDATELAAVMFDGVDKLQHLCWRFLAPQYEHTVTDPWEQRIRERSLDYFRQLDDLLEQMVGLAGGEALVVLASDHGFGAQKRTFFVNAWLEEGGYLAWSDDRGPQPSDSEVLGIGQLARHVYQMDWERTRAYTPTPSGNGIHIVRASEEYPNGVSDGDYEAFRDRLIDGLLAVRDPDSDVRVVSKVWKREDAFAGPKLELAPDLTLELQDGGLVSILASEQAVVPRSEPLGTHRPEGIFIARGPEIKRGVELSRLSILDVPSLLVHGLGLPVPADFEGRVPVEAFRAEALEDRPVEEGESVEPTAKSSPSEVDISLDEETEAEIARRLRALGYLE